MKDITQLTDEKVKELIDFNTSIIQQFYDFKLKVPYKRKNN